MKVRIGYGPAYLVPVELVGQIVEIECVNGDNYSDKGKWRIKGEPEVTTIRESQIVTDDQVGEIKNEMAVEKLRRVEKEFSALKKKILTDTLVQEWASGHPDVTEKEVSEFVGQRPDYLIATPTIHDFRKWRDQRSSK